MRYTNSKPPTQLLSSPIPATKSWFYHHLPVSKWCKYPPPSISPPLTKAPHPALRPDLHSLRHRCFDCHLSCAIRSTNLCSAATRSTSSTDHVIILFSSAPSPKYPFLAIGYLFRSLGHPLLPPAHVVNLAHCLSSTGSSYWGITGGTGCVATL